MKIQILSDLHIEFEGHPYLECDCDVVVLAGDIHVKDRGVKWSIENIKEKPVIYILGNHEFYGKTYPKLIDELKELTENTNVHILEKDVITINEVNFLGTTLWTDFELLGDPRIAGYECQQVMTDYKKIRKLPGYSKLRSLDTAIYHKHSKAWIEKELEQRMGEKNVVVTHHGPSMRSVPDYYREDIITSAYVSDLEDLIMKYQPSGWIHGHLHNSSDYMIGSTRVICNPKGYPSELNSDFNPIKIFEP
jgi:Icc-related predicted phosphoesterase